MFSESVRAAKVLLAALLGVGAFTMPAMAQLDFTTFQFGTSTITTVTGIRGNNMTGNYSIANSGGDTGGLLLTPSFGNVQPFPVATASGSNFPGATSSTPYGPSFGSPTGILRVVGSFKTAASNLDLGYLYDGAASPGRQITPLIYPGGATLNTIAHSNFGNQVVGNYDTRLATGNAFVYDIPSGTFTTNNKPGAVSTTAYGVYGNRIAGGYTDPGPGGLTHAYIYTQSTGAFTTYDAPGATVVTHFEGITGGGRSNEYNLVADSVDALGQVHAWAVHVVDSGAATWTEIAVPGGSVTSANSIYGNTVIGVYVQDGVTRAYSVNVPGLYNPITNTGTLAVNTANMAAITGAAGDDILNSGSILAGGVNGVGVSSNSYSVVNNTGVISATGIGGTAVQMAGSFGSLLNAGLIHAGPGAVAIGTTPTSIGTLVVNNGVIDGPVAIAAGPYARFENSGWLGVSSAGAGITHAISGTFAQTSAGTLALRVGANGTSDTLLVNGQARLAGTAVAAFQPGAALSNSYTLLTATGGFTGNFAALSTRNLASFLTASLNYSGSNVTLNLQSSLAAPAGLGGDQISVGRALDWAFNAGPGLGGMPGLFGL
ncbi:MAG: autotransporter outer membrane beta-barrel domain-containing protein, partial [Solimonas sp.]